MDSRIYTEIDPFFQWVPGEEFDTIIFQLTGFSKEQLKAEVDTSRNLRISGERPTVGNQWCRFLKSFPLSKDCDVKMIKAKFEDGILYVVLPKPMAEDSSAANSNVQVPKKQGKIILNVLLAITIIVVAGLGTYAAYKLRSHKRETQQI